MEFGPEYENDKAQWMERDGWKDLDAKIEAIEAGYRECEPANKAIFEQTAAIMRYGHFNDRLAYPVFAIARLMQHRINATDATVNADSTELATKYFDRMARARDLLLAAARLLDGDDDVDEVVGELVGRLMRQTGDPVDWSEMEYGLLHFSGSWFADEKDAKALYDSLIADQGQPNDSEYLVRRQVRKL